MAQEEESSSTGCVIKTFDQISERPPRGGLSFLWVQVYDPIKLLKFSLAPSMRFRRGNREPEASSAVLIPEYGRTRGERMKHVNAMASLGLALVLAIALAAASVQAQSQEADATSKAFIKTAIQNNNAEIELGKLALSKGQSSAIRQFGQTLVADHQKANEEAKTAANAVGVKPPDATLVTIGTMMKLEAQSGNAFDRSFIDTMISDRRKDITTYQEQTGKNNAVGHYARQVLPTLQKHLQDAERIRQQLSEITGSK